MIRKISAIAVSGLSCSGKTTLATKLASSLGWDHVNTGQYLRDMTQANGIRIEDFGKLDISVLRCADASVLENMQKKVHTVWEGRLSMWLARDLPFILRIFIIANKDVRGERMARRDTIEPKTANVLLNERDNEEAKVFNDLYGIRDVSMEGRPDLILDSSRQTTDDLLTAILQNQSYVIV